MSLVDRRRLARLPGWISLWVHMRNLSPVSEMRLKVKDPGEEFWRQIRETKQTWPNTKILAFGPIMIALVTLKAVSLRLNWILMMWQCKTMLSGPPEFIPPFIPVTGMKCSYGKISSPLTEISGTEPARPLSWTHRKFYKGIRGKA